MTSTYQIVGLSKSENIAQSIPAWVIKVFSKS